MATKSIQCTAARLEDDRAIIEFSTGVGVEFRSIGEAREYCLARLDDDTLTALLILRFLEAGATAANIGLLVGRTATINTTLNNIVRIS